MGVLKMTKPENFMKADATSMVGVRGRDEEYKPRLRKKIKPPPTNTEVVVDLMTYSPYGSLSQIMILEAIRHYVEMVAKSPMDENSKAATIINPAAWNGCAKNIQERMEVYYRKSRDNSAKDGSGEEDSSNSGGVAESNADAN